MARIRVKPTHFVYDSAGNFRIPGDEFEARPTDYGDAVEIIDTEPEVGGAPVPQVRRRGRPPRDKAFEVPFDKAPADNEVPE